jgi:small subunit ribosomal protein S17
MPETPEETPENLQEEVETAAAAGGDATGSQEEAAAPAQAPDPKATRRERLEVRRSERAATARAPRTPEERQAERVERRKALAAERRRYRTRSKAKQAERRKAQPAPEAAHAPDHGPGRAKVRQGVVISDKGEKTITVQIDVVKRHKRYHKIMRSRIKLYAHDERNDAHAGDTVRVVECRPMSRSKRWRLAEIVERAR